MPRKRGDGSIVQRPNGLWQASLQLNGTRRTVYAKTERAVRAKLRDLQRQMDTTGALPAPGRRMVSDLLEAWLDSAPNLKLTTITQYRQFAALYILPAIGGVRLERVTPDRLQKLYATLSPSVADKVHRILHRAFAVAVRWGWLGANPSERVLRPAYKSARPTMWSQAELDAFLAGAAEHWLYSLWLLLAATGLRLGEALALRWDGVGLGGVALTVTGTLHRSSGGQWTISSPKTAAGVRTVILPPVAAAVLAAQRDQQDAQRTAAGSAWQEYGLVFTGETGQPLYPSTVQHALKRECARLNLPAVTPHGLRHLHASLLIADGIPVPAVAARLGHASPNVTMKLYAHALPGQDVAAAQAIAAALSVESRGKVGLGVERK